VVDELGYADLDTFLAAIGEHHVSPRSVAQKVSKAFHGGGEGEQLPTTVFTPRGHRRRSDGSVGVHVEGLDDVLVRLANCCTPVPGDEILGFVTRGRGVSVHRIDCANAMSLAAEQATRMIDVEWDRDSDTATFKVAVEVVALDRTRLLRDVANALAEHHVNIVSCETVTGDDRVARMRFGFEMSNPAQLNSVLTTIKQIDGVYDAFRILPGGAPARN
jgi:GTP pyrophosphokinase